MKNQIVVAGSTAALAEKADISLAEAFMEVEVMVVIDVSASMSYYDAPGGKSREAYAQEQLMTLQQRYAGKIGLIAFAERAAYLPGGYIVNDGLGGSTNISEGLLQAMVASEAMIPVFLITDGEPNYGDEERTIQVAQMMPGPLHCIYVGPEGGEGYAFLQRLGKVTNARTVKKASEIGNFLNELQDVLLLGG